MVDFAFQIAIGSDHAGFHTKEFIKKSLAESGYQIRDFGTFSEASMDYPDTGHPVAKSVQSGEYRYGILVCGSGNGMAMTANKYSGIRAALCWNGEIASLARRHNNANVITLPARFISPEEAVDLCRIFLTTEFEGGRHQARIDKISNLL